MNLVIMSVSFWRNIENHNLAKETISIFLKQMVTIDYTLLVRVTTYMILI